MFARTYAPSKAPEAVQAWQTDLHSKNRAKLADAIADPNAHPELFEEGWDGALRREAGAPLANGKTGTWFSGRGYLCLDDAHACAVSDTDTPASEDDDDDEDEDDEEEDESEEES